MRYSKEHKEQIRHKLLALSGGLAKKSGFSASGMDALAAAAGMTVGAMYKHFSSKDELFAALIEHELTEAANRFIALADADEEARSTMLNRYLSVTHVKTPEFGCPLPALTAEVARAPKAVRQEFSEGLTTIRDALTKLTGSQANAWVMMAQNVGAVMLARAMDDEALQRELLAAVRESAAGMVETGPDKAVTDAGLPD